jgi:hypothetical protein
MFVSFSLTNAARWLAIMLVFTVAAFITYPMDRVVLPVLVFATAMAGIALAPGKLGLLSWSAGIPIFYGVFFAVLPLLTRLSSPEDALTEAKVPPALLVAALGLTAFVAGTNIMRLSKGPEPAYNMGGLLNLDVTKKPFVLMVLILIGGAALLWSFLFGYFGLNQADGAGDSAGAISIISFSLTIAHAMAWNSYFSKKMLLKTGIFTTLLLVGSGVLANSKSTMLAPLVIIGLTYWGVSRRIPYKLIIASVLFYVLVVFPFVTASRYAMAASQFTGGKLDLAGKMLDYLSSNEWSQVASDFDAVENLGTRLLPYFADIIHQTGHTLPFMEGRTISQGFEATVPRFIYPDKPALDIGNWTAKEYGAIGWHDDITNLSPTFMGEFYMNFGIVGVLVGMFLVGVLAVCVDRYLIVSCLTWTMPIMVFFVRWQDSFIGHTILPFLKNLIVLVPILLLMRLIIGRARKVAEPAVSNA